MSYPLRLPAAAPLVTVTNPLPELWVIELHNGEDSRLTRALINDGLRPALDAVEKDWRERRRASQAKGSEGGAGALVIVGKRGQNKFFSNGLDFASAKDDPTFLSSAMYPLYTRVLTFPIPTVAAINGHCFAGAMLLTLACDYRIMTDGSQRRAWMCMNEVHFGTAFPKTVAALLRAKCGNALLLRKLVLDGHRFSPAEALEGGFVDKLVKGDTEAILADSMDFARTVAPLAKTGVWGLIKQGVYSDVIEASRDDYARLITPEEDDLAARARL